MFIVTRHGESVWNKENKFAGWIDIDLSEKGIRESTQLGELLKDYHFDYIISSDLQRAQQTVQYAMKTRAYITSAMIRERNYGDLAGMQIISCGLWNKSIPNGESIDDVSNRVCKYFDETILPLLNQNKNILLIAHDNTLRVLFIHLGIHTNETIEKVAIGNAIPIRLFSEKFSHTSFPSMELILPSNTLCKQYQYD